MKIKRIAVDPGHGGRDPGVVSGDYLEKTVNLQLSAELFSALISSRYEPLLLREGDLDMSLSSRVQKAADWKADLFISIHHNGHSNPKARGTETYHFPDSIIGMQAAEFIQQELVSLLAIPNRGVKASSSFFVLRHTPMPAVLLEPLFLTNTFDRYTLICENYYIKLANLMVKSLDLLNNSI